MSLPTSVIKYTQVTKYVKKIGRTTKILFGAQLRPEYYHEKLDYNNFSITEKKIPQGYKRVRLSAEHIKKFHFDKSKMLLKKDNPMYKKMIKKYKGFKRYFTHDNGGRSFLIYVNKKDNIVDVYKVPSDKYYFDANDYISNPNYYIELIASYKPIQIFVGKSQVNEMTTFSGGFGKEFDGNSILLKLSKQKYIFIGFEIYEFSINDDIHTFYSPIGNSNVPYPFAIGEKNIYFMLNKEYLSTKDFFNCSPKNTTDAYAYFYSENNNCNFKEKIKKMEKLRTIHKRIW